MRGTLKIKEFLAYSKDDYKVILDCSYLLTYPSKVIRFTLEVVERVISVEKACQVFDYRPDIDDYDKKLKMYLKVYDTEDKIVIKLYEAIKYKSKEEAYVDTIQEGETILITI